MPLKSSDRRKTKRHQGKEQNVGAAVPRVADQWFTLDREWTILDCGDGVPAIVAHSVGRCIWDAFPGSREKFEPVYQKGWDRGHSSGNRVYWNEILTTVQCFVVHDVLHVSFQYLSVDGLTESIDAVLAARGDDRDPHEQQPRHRLRLVV